jgi:hypothetical protein
LYKKILIFDCHCQYYYYISRKFNTIGRRKMGDPTLDSGEDELGVEKNSEVDLLAPEYWVDVQVISNGQIPITEANGDKGIYNIDYGNLLRFGSTGQEFGRGEPIPGCKIYSVDNGKIARLDIPSGMADPVHGRYEVKYSITPVRNGLSEALDAAGYTQNSNLFVPLSNGETPANESALARWNQLKKDADASWPKKEEMSPENPTKKQ